MKLTFLGTGTSHGIPMIGCECSVCTSGDPKNTRTRSSVLIEVDHTSLLIDTSPEFRLQALRERIHQIDAVLYTHAHADHLFGLDDIRRFNDITGKAISCYGSAETLQTIRRAFEYVFVSTQIGGGKPQLELIDVTGSFNVKGTKVTPIPVHHGKINVLGYRIGNLAYITDCSNIPDSSSQLLANLDTLILGVLRVEPHETHFSMNQGLAVVEKLQPKRALFTHIAHRLDHEATNRILPSNIQLAHDGLQIEL